MRGSIRQARSSSRGSTRSLNFPVTTGAFDTTFNRPPAGDNTALAQDVFITRLDPTGSQVTYSTLFGGVTYEAVTDMVVDAQGFLTVVGYTTSSASGVDMPVTAGALDTTWNGSEDGFVARFKLDGAGTADLKYSTFIGGVNWDNLFAVALNPADPEDRDRRGLQLGQPDFGDQGADDSREREAGADAEPAGHAAFPRGEVGLRHPVPVPFHGRRQHGLVVVRRRQLRRLPQRRRGRRNRRGHGSRRHEVHHLQTTRGAVDRTMNGVSGGAYDCFVWKISGNGSQLLYSTYLGGRGDDCDFFSQGAPRLHRQQHIRDRRLHGFARLPNNGWIAAAGGR